MNRYSWLRGVKAGLVGVVLVIGGVARGEVVPKDKELLKRLDAAEWSTREDASVELSAQAWDLARLKEMYREAPSLEARDRVLAGARQQFFAKLIAGRSEAGDAAALGVLKPTNDTPVEPAGSLVPVKALFVTSTVCGMPSALVLRPGDRIVKIGDVDLTQLGPADEPFDALSMKIRKTKAGETVGLVLERDGQVVQASTKVISGIGMRSVEQTRGFGPRPEVLERWLQEQEKITGTDE